VVGREVNAGDGRVALRADRLDERVRFRCEPVVRGDHQQRESRELRNPVGDAPLRRIGDHLVGHALGGHARERLHIVGHDRDGSRAGQRRESARISHRDEDGADDPAIVRGSECGDPATHAVSADDESTRVDAETARVRGITEKGEHGIRVLEIVGEPELTWTAPRAAIVHGNGIPPIASYRLRDVEVLLVAGQSVKQHQRRMNAGARCQVRDAVDLYTTGRNVQDDHPRGMRAVTRRIYVDRARDLLRRERGGRDPEDGNDKQQAHGEVIADGLL